METKKEIRDRIQKQRSVLSWEEVEKRSIIINDKLIALSEYQKATLILCYIDFRREVRTEKVIRHAWTHGKKVAVPRVEGQRMEFYKIDSYEELEKGSMGILEPCSICPVTRIGNENAIAIVPGVAFDRKGNRIGYGGGYYDRYFQDKPEIYKVGMAFDFQVIPEIRCERHDIKMNGILTETR